MIVKVSQRQPSPKVPLNLVKSVLKKVFEIDHKDGEVSVLLWDDEGIRKLNKEYRGIDRPTDVLSFALNDGDFPDPHPDVWGDIVISVERAAQQAEESGRTTHEEIVRLLIHGALHLIGFDHEGSQRDAEKMMKKEAEILSRCNQIIS